MGCFYFESFAIPTMECKVGFASPRSTACPSARSQLATLRADPDDWRRVVRKHARHRREVADVPVDDRKQRADGGLVGRDRVEVHISRLRSGLARALRQLQQHRRHIRPAPSRGDQPRQ